MTKSSRKKDTQMAAERDPSTTKPGTSSVPQNAVEPKPTKARRPITDPTTAQQENAVAQQGRTGRLPDRVKRPGANSDTNWQRSVPSGARTARPIQSRRPLAVSLQINRGWRTDTLGINDDGQEIWLKDAFSRDGQRIGVGPCCLGSDPCAWHEALEQMQRGFPEISSKALH